MLLAFLWDLGEEKGRVFVWSPVGVADPAVIFAQFIKRGAGVDDVVQPMEMTFGGCFFDELTVSSMVSSVSPNCRR